MLSLSAHALSYLKLWTNFIYYWHQYFKLFSDDFLTAFSICLIHNLKNLIYFLVHKLLFRPAQPERASHQSLNSVHVCPMSFSNVCQLDLILQKNEFKILIFTIFVRFILFYFICFILTSFKVSLVCLTN